MKTETIQQLQDRAIAFAQKHLVACAADVVEWETSGELPYGRLRELVELFAFAGSNSRTLAKAEVQRLAMRQYLALAEEKKTFSAAGYAQEQLRAAQAQNDELRADSKWKFELWFNHGDVAFHELTPYGIASAAWTASRRALAEQVDEALQESVNNYVSPTAASAAT